MNREEFLKSLGLMAVGSALTSSVITSCSGKGTSEETTDSTSTDTMAKSNAPFFKISLAEWSFHKALFGNEMTNLDFPAKAKNDFGITGIEYVNQFFKDKAKDQAYLADLKQRCDDLGVTSVLIMCDGEGELGNADEKLRVQAVENHYKWVEAAKFLGCHSIRVNAAGEGTAEAVAKAATDGLHKLSTFAKDFNIGVIVENHGSYSSNGEWLSGVISAVGLDNCGTLPDFGNFCINRTKPETNTPEGWANTKCLEEYDRYKGVKELMPFAKGVSAKTYTFDEQGNCVETDYNQMLAIVKAAGYNGYIGIEYEGSGLSEEEGIRATKALLERVGATV